MDGKGKTSRVRLKANTVFFMLTCRCNGNRGWFPSNYVKIIEDYGSTGLVVRINYLLLEAFETKRVLIVQKSYRQEKRYD